MRKGKVCYMNEKSKVTFLRLTVMISKVKPILSFYNSSIDTSLLDSSKQTPNE